MLYPSPIQLLHVYGPIAHGVLQGGPKGEWHNTSLVLGIMSRLPFVFLSVVKCGRVCGRSTHILA